jgi:hypothetical protein
MPILSAIGAGFGSDKVTPRYFAPSLKTPLVDLGKQALSSLSTGGAEAERNYNLGTAKQTELQGRQENVLNQLLQNRLNTNPTQLLSDVGRTAFNFIDPNVISPLSRFDVNYDTLTRRVRGLNPAAIESTADRLRNARIASGRYYDVARQVYGALPSLYNQVFNAGLSNDEIARGYIPEIMSGYRRLDMAPAEAAMIRANLANTGAGNVNAINNALRSGVYGYKQDRNIWDRLGAVDTSMWNSLKDAVQMAGSVYGMVGGMGGGMGGGGGGGGGSFYNGPEGAQLKPQFVPYTPAVPIGPGGTYNPGPPVQSFDLPPEYQPGMTAPPPGWYPG